MKASLLVTLGALALTAPATPSDIGWGGDPGDVVLGCACLPRHIVVWNAGYDGGTGIPLLVPPCSDYNTASGEGCDPTTFGCVDIGIFGYIGPDGVAGTAYASSGEVPCGATERFDVTTEGGVIAGTLGVSCSSCVVVFGG